MLTDFSGFEIELECLKCDTDWVVTGKRLTQSRDVPCPTCGEVVRVDVWGYHAQWRQLRKMLDGY